MEQYWYWIATTAIGLMIGALGFFLKRTLSELEKKVERSESASSGRSVLMEKRLEKLEDRFDNLLKEMPDKYASRDDMIRMNQGLEYRLDKIQDTLMDIKRGA